MEQSGKSKKLNLLTEKPSQLKPTRLSENFYHVKNGIVFKTMEQSSKLKKLISMRKNLGS